jgi:uncharacterized SAM-binding protein YcdF (DUF218 family)
VFALIWLAVWVLLGITVLAYGGQDQAQPADVIIVLGSGLRRDNSPGPALYRRAARAAELYQHGLAPAIICTGGFTAGRSRSEADACREVLEDAGVPADVIFVEDGSRSTEENALFAHQIMRDNGWTNAVLVSDGYHLLRAQWIFSQEGIPVYPSPAASPSRMPLFIGTLREVAALHWQAFKTLFNLPFTYVPVM